MKTSLQIAVGLLAALLGTGAWGQEGSRPGGPPASQATPTVTSVLDTQLTIVEREFVGIAQAMPEDKYSFAPTNGEFKGVRTFAQQVKHVATVNDRIFEGVLGEISPVAPDEGITSNGPDALQTKDQIVQYLKDSFAKGHKAIATITPANAFEPLKNPAVPFLSTRGALAIFACTHAMDHYGQIVEYLRDNGIVPPASRQRPPANPSPKP